MNHVVISPGPGEIGYGCKCGKRFPTQKTADLHAKDQNLIEENEAKAKKAEGQATELALQAHETTERPKEPEAPAQSPIATEPPTERSRAIATQSRNQGQTRSRSHWPPSPRR
jgi:hypothetical protein